MTGIINKNSFSPLLTNVQVTMTSGRVNIFLSFGVVSVWVFKDGWCYAIVTMCSGSGDQQLSDNQHPITTVIKPIKSAKII